MARSMSRPLYFRLCVVSLSALLVLGGEGCEGTTANFLRGTVTLYPTAQKNYDAGLRELKASNWMAAVQYFTHVRTNFGFSKWATMAELGIADANVGRDKYTEAIDGYKTFIKAHPGHEHVQDGYAAFKIGECYHKQIPGDWILAPPSYEKDQGPVLDALRELQAFADQYPASPYVAKGRKMIGECVRRLTDHELYVARFYLDRDKPYAAIGRLESVLREYPGGEREPEALLLLGKTYIQMKKLDRAREVFWKLANDHATDYRAQKGKLYIEFLDKQKAEPPKK